MRDPDLIRALALTILYKAAVTQETRDEIVSEIRVALEAVLARASA